MNWNNAKLVHVAKVDNLRYDCHFVATNDEYVWKDTPDRKAINAAFRNKEDMADTIPYDHVQDVSWTALEIIPGYQIRIRGEDEGQIGDTPHEAATYLEFEETYSIDRDPLTTEDTIEDQISEILLKLHGAVHYKTIPNYLNYEHLDIDEPITEQKVLSKLNKMESNTSTYRTTDGDEWWSNR